MRIREDVVAVIMGGGRGTRLFPLTKERCKPAVPIGGRYRLIDIPISNCINSGINKIFVLTQFNTASLHRHIERTYRFDIFSGGFCALKAAEQTLDDSDWYQGTADAVRQNVRYLPEDPNSLILTLSGDQLYRMDYSDLIRFHVEKNADVTIAVNPVDRELAPAMGLVHVQDDLRIIRFVEKPKQPEILDMMATDPKALQKLGFKVEPARIFMANMGIYLCSRRVLEKLLEKEDHIDFGKEVLPSNLENFRMFAYPFPGFWEDIGTTKAFYDANMALTERAPVFSFFDRNAPIFTRPRFLPPTKIEHCVIDHSLIAEGGFLEECQIHRCLLSDRSVIRKGTILREVYMMGADEMEGREEREHNKRLGRPDIGVGMNCRIERAIIDKGARIGSNVQIRSQADSADRDGPCFHIRDGITIIPRRMIVPDGTII